MAEDLRIQKTYKALEDAFKELFKEKSFEDITVKELCGRAMIRTATFYNHFTDKYDFFYSMTRRMHEEGINNVMPDASTATPEEFLERTLMVTYGYVEKNKDYIWRMEAAHVLAPTLYSLSDRASGDFASALASLKGVRLNGDPDVLSEMFYGALSRIVHWWMTKDITAGELAAVTLPVFCGMLFSPR